MPTSLRSIWKKRQQADERLRVKLAHIFFTHVLYTLSIFLMRYRYKNTESLVVHLISTQIFYRLFVSRFMTNAFWNVSGFQFSLWNRSGTLFQPFGSVLQDRPFGKLCENHWNKTGFFCEFCVEHLQTTVSGFKNFLLLCSISFQRKFHAFMLIWNCRRNMA